MTFPGIKPEGFTVQYMDVLSPVDILEDTLLFSIIAIVEGMSFIAGVEVTMGARGTMLSVVNACMDAVVLVEATVIVVLPDVVSSVVDVVPSVADVVPSAADVTGVTGGSGLEESSSADVDIVGDGLSLKFGLGISPLNISGRHVTYTSSEAV